MKTHRFMLALAVASLAGPLPAQPGPLATLHDQVAAWNRGDLDGFLAGYARVPEFRFYSGGNVVDSLKALEERYRKRYGSANAADFGSLEFRDLEELPAGPDAALVRGRWRVSKPADAKSAGEAGKKTKTLTGLFTLLMRKVEGRWKIVHDHTSEGEPE